MLKRYLRLGENHTLAEVIGFLQHPRFENEGMPFLVVISAEGTLAGMVSPRSIFAALSAGAEACDDESLLQLAQERLPTSIREVMVTAPDSLRPESELREIFTVFAHTRAPAVPVLEEGRVIGLITPRILFDTASRLALDNAESGIQLP